MSDSPPFQPLQASHKIDNIDASADVIVRHAMY